MGGKWAQEKKKWGCICRMKSTEIVLRRGGDGKKENDGGDKSN
jgi:hypothetical protein